jgi:hypothetical protein
MSDPAETWITELDGIDALWYRNAFNYTRLGRLPPELLEMIVKNVPKKSLSALARINPVLRDLVERHLYHHINVDGYKDTVIWPLYRTLVSRPDLANKVRIFECMASNKEDVIDVDVSPLTLHDQALYSVAEVSLNQITIVGCIVLQRLSNVDKVCLKLRRTCSRFLESDFFDPLGDLVPGFHTTSPHTLRFPGLQTLTKLDYDGIKFHWALAKSPCLRWLKLSRPCIIVKDEAPNEVSTSLVRLEIHARSSILRSSGRTYSFFKKFLAHFPALLELKLTITDVDIEQFRELGDVLSERSYDYLLEKLSPVASHLRTLELGVFNSDDRGFPPSDFFSNHEVNTFLHDVLPASGFRHFTKLEKLVVPYQGLLGHTQSPVDPVPSPDRILPATLAHLQIDCPQIHVYEWLAQLHIVRRWVPDLSEIILYSQLPYGDEYPVMYHENHEHRAVRILSDLDISLTWKYRAKDWKEEWNEYDLEAPKVIEWLEGLGA